MTGCDIQIGSKKNKEDKVETINPVLIQQINRSDISRNYTSNGVLEAANEVVLFSQSAGHVIKIEVEEGMRVKKNQVLIKLNNEEQKLTVEKAKVRLELEKSNLERVAKLFEKKMVPDDEFQRAELAVRDAEISFEQSQLNLEKTTVKAPITGIISNRYIDVGDRIDFSTRLFSLVDNSKLKLNLWVNERDVDFLRIGMDVNIIGSGTNAKAITGKLIRINPTIDPTFGKLKATIEISDNISNLRPGQFVNVELNLETHYNVLKIPKRSLIWEAGIPVIFTYSDSIAWRCPVELGIETGDFVELLSGAVQGDYIITDGQSTLRDSTKVRPVEMQFLD